MRRIERPGAGEYPEYANMYIGLLPNDSLLLKHMKENLKATTELIQSLSGEQLMFRYAGGK